MKKGIFNKLLIMTLSEVLLSVLLFIVLIFSFSYISTNLYVFTDLSILTYGSGFETIWMGLYLGTNTLFTLVIFLVLLEIGLFTLRMMAKVALNTITKVTGKENPKIDLFFKNLSLVALLKKMKFNNHKRVIITYLVLMLLIFGVNFVTKTILNTNESPLYRVYENISLYHDTYSEDFTEELSEGNDYSLSIHTSVGNVHLYTMQETSDVQIIYYYDTLDQKYTLNYSIDKDSNIINVEFNQNILTYQPYEDDLLPQIEIYLPESLSILNVEITVTNYGTVAMEYFNATNLVLNVNHANVNIDLANDQIDHYQIEANNSTIRVNTKYTKTFEVIASNSSMNISLGDVESEAPVIIGNQSTLYFYQTILLNMNISSSFSTVDIREVYAENVMISTIQDDFTYLNGTPSNQPSSISVTVDGSEMNVKGITYDSEGTTE